MEGGIHRYVIPHQGPGIAAQPVEAFSHFLHFIIIHLVLQFGLEIKRALHSASWACCLPRKDHCPWAHTDPLPASWEAAYRGLCKVKKGKPSTLDSGGSPAPWHPVDPSGPGATSGHGPMGPKGRQELCVMGICTTSPVEVFHTDFRASFSP